MRNNPFYDFENLEQRKTFLALCSNRMNFDLSKFLEDSQYEKLVEFMDLFLGRRICFPNFSILHTYKMRTLILEMHKEGQNLESIASRFKLTPTNAIKHLTMALKRLKVDYTIDDQGEVISNYGKDQIDCISLE